MENDAEKLKGGADRFAGRPSKSEITQLLVTVDDIQELIIESTRALSPRSMQLSDIYQRVISKEYVPVKDEWRKTWRDKSRGGAEVLFATYDNVGQVWLSMQRGRMGGTFAFTHRIEQDTSPWDLMPIEHEVVKVERWGLFNIDGVIECISDTEANAQVSASMLKKPTRIVKLSGEYTK